MQNHYKTLGLTNAASSAEVRRAYRVLARRYHPDVNPDGNNDEIFKAIALAYAVLSDPEKRRQHDLDLRQSSESLEQTFERAREALRKNQQAAAYAKQQRPGEWSAHSKPAHKTSSTATSRTSSNPKPASPPQPRAHPLSRLVESPRRAVESLRKAVAYARSTTTRRTPPTVKQLAVVEVSISIHDAIRGTRRPVDISDGRNEHTKVSITIPPGVRTGSIIRLRSKDRVDSEIVAVIKVENHQWLSLSERGLTMELPITIAEAIEGAKIQVPSLGDPLLVTVDPLTQSGKEVRLKNQGVFNRDGTRGDLYIRFIVKIPTKPLPEEIQSLTELLADLYPIPVRQHLPTKLFEE